MELPTMDMDMLKVMMDVTLQSVMANNLLSMIVKQINITLTVDCF